MVGVWGLAKRYLGANFAAESGNLLHPVPEG